jgi:hypothetical protein
MGQSLVDVYITEEYRASVKEVLDNALQGREAANFEFPLFTKNKQRVEVLLNGWMPFAPFVKTWIVFLYA